MAQVRRGGAVTIPTSTSLISVLRAPISSTEEAYGAPASRAVVASGIRAVLSLSRGYETSSGATQSVRRYKLICDPLNAVDGGISHDDWIRDDATQIVYAVTAASLKPGFGMDHVTAYLVLVDGPTPGVP